MYKLYHKKYLKEDFIMWWLMQQTQIIPHIRAIWFSLRNPDHVKKTNFATFLICSKHKLCHIFEPLWFDLSKTYFQRFTFYFHSHHWWVINSWLIFFTRFSWIVVLTRENRENKMARICGKICVCCICHHMNKSSFKYFYVAKFIPSRILKFWHFLPSANHHEIIHPDKIK